MKSLKIAGDLKDQYPDCSLEELAFDVAVCTCNHRRWQDRTNKARCRPLCSLSASLHTSPETSISWQTRKRPSRWRRSFHTARVSLFDTADYRGISSHTIETGYHQLCEVIDPSFDHINRLVMKVACTWEGMQAARSLKARGIKTLATTVFSMQQAILAGEVGCVSISPFCYELKALMDET